MGPSSIFLEDREATISTTDGITFDCRSENHVPMVPVTRHQSTPANVARMDCVQDAEPEVVPFAQRPNAKPTSRHNPFTHLPRDPNCEICKMIKTMCARSQKRPDMRTDGIAPPTQFAEVIAADHKVSSEDNESRLQHRHGVVVQDVYSCWIQPPQEQQRLRHEEKCATLLSAIKITRNINTDSQVGITTNPLLTDLKRTGQPKEPFDGSQEEQHQCSVERDNGM